MKSDDLSGKINYLNLYYNTLSETNIAPKNDGLEDEHPFGKAYFQALC